MLPGSISIHAFKTATKYWVRLPEPPANWVPAPIVFCHHDWAEGKMVGAVRFELTTSCTRNKRASQPTLRPEPDQELAVSRVEMQCLFLGVAARTEGAV